MRASSDKFNHLFVICCYLSAIHNNLNNVESILKYSPRPPQTPAIHLSSLDNVNLSFIIRLFYFIIEENSSLYKLYLKVIDLFYLIT